MKVSSEPEPGTPDPQEEPPEAPVGEPTDPVDPLKRDEEQPGPDPPTSPFPPG